MKHAASQNLYAYWNWLRAGRSAPERADIDPAAIRGVLADTLMVEVEGLGPGRTSLPVRLSGTRVNAIFGTDIKGRCLTTLWRERDRAMVDGMISAVLDDARPVVAGVTAAPRGYNDLSLELVLLPLRHHGKTHARILGALSPASIPPWLGLVAAEPLSLASHRILHDRVEPPAWQPFERRQEVASRPGNTPVRRGHFLIFEGGRANARDREDVGVR